MIDFFELIRIINNKLNRIKDNLEQMRQVKCEQIHL